MSVPALRFKEFTDSWTFDPIGKILKVKSGYGFKASEYSLFGVKLLQIENVGYGTVNWNTPSYLPLEYLDKYPELHLKENDIVLALNRPVTNNQLKISKLTKMDSPSILYQRVGKLCFIVKSINPDYIFQVFTTYVKNFVLKQSIGSDQPFISITSLYKFNIPLPSLPEQTKIANFLKAVDEKITQITKEHDLLTQYRKGVLQQIFSQELRFKDDGREFPEWEEMLASDVFINVANKNHNGDLPILAATQDKGMIYREDSGLDIKSSEASVKSYKIVEKGDFVISLRSFQGGIEYSNVRGICSPAYTVMKPKIDINNGFFKAYLKKDDFIESLNSLVIGIRDGKQISYSAFATLMLPYPSINEQTKIANFLTAIDDKITATQAQLDAVKQYKLGLLQQMFI